jgi:hypothetical protein
VHRMAVPAAWKIFSRTCHPIPAGGARSDVTAMGPGCPLQRGNRYSGVCFPRDAVQRMAVPAAWKIFSRTCQPIPAVTGRSDVTGMGPGCSLQRGNRYSDVCFPRKAGHGMAVPAAWKFFPGHVSLSLSDRAVGCDRYGPGCSLQRGNRYSGV